ncbi:dicarboxylate/amino acid:cation symporter [uncultured Prevotella sp.]|uniref:dicarboxylate/amino acid:cation symporter n=1 Tax=uncultured Prevotella sp. TaxID=159272 RepID=UPI00258DCE55|nr:dicarboxylate/amino acid:cation symporter [uncultured Prevotella sp.]
MKTTVIWIGALIIGAILGLLGLGWLDEVMNFVATVYTRLFQLLAVPTIVLAVMTTFATFGSKGSGRIFGRTLIYTLLTTFAAAAVGAVLYVVIAPGNLPVGTTLECCGVAAAQGPDVTYTDHILSIIPNNIVKPFLEGNVLSLLLLAFAIGFGLSKLPESENKSAVVKFLLGLQELLFLLIRGLIWTLPLGIIAFAAQLSAQVSLVRGLNPLHVLSKMTPAVLMALFTKSSAATLPVTMDTAENRLGISSKVARFVLPICTTINMNGCAAFILVTSLFVMQNGGTPLTWSTILLWILISVVSAVGNAGVPMGCYFLTLSLMSGIGAPVAVLGVILPIYTIIDMIETAENVWSDSCVSAMVDKDLT